MKNKRGFTLVELIVVIAIIAILTTIAVPLVSGYVNDAQTAACREEMDEWMKVYQLDRGIAVNAGGYSGDAGVVASVMDKLGGESNDAGGYTGICPYDGVYTVDTGAHGTVLLTCSLHGSAGGASGGLSGFGPNVPGWLQELLIEDINSQFMTHTSRVDSTAPDAYDAGGNAGEETWKKKVLDHLKSKDVFMGADNIKSWLVHKEGSQIVYWMSDQDIATVDAGTWVRVIRYNDNKKTYTAGYMMVTQSSPGSEYSESYNILAGGVKDSVWKEAKGQNDGTKDSYEQTVAIFNALEETTQNPNE